MKKLMYLMFFSLCLASCISAELTEKQDDNKVKLKLDSLTTAWHRAATVADFERYMQTMDSTAVYVGTAVEEVWSKPEFYQFAKPFFDKGKTWDFQVVKRNGYLSENKMIYWFDEVLNTWMGLCRGSGVWEKIKGEWKLKHYVLSVIVSNKDISDVVNVKKLNDFIYLKEQKIKPKIETKEKE